MKPSKSNQKLVWQYAGLATQLLLGLGLMLWVGARLDQYFAFKGQFLVWILPLLLLLGLFVKVIRDTSK